MAWGEAHTKPEGDIDNLQAELDACKIEIERLRSRERAARALVEEQAEDEALWFVGQRTAAEAYLQEALRRLHSTIEAAD